MNEIPYALAMGSIMYAILYTRPNVAYALGIASRFQTDPKEDHSKADDSKSISEYVFILNDGAVSWKSSKQQMVSGSINEAEYIAASEAIKEAVWMKKFIIYLGVIPKNERPVSLYRDNTGAIIQAKEPRSHYRSKHILRCFHLVKDKMLSLNEQIERII